MEIIKKTSVFIRFLGRVFHKVGDIFTNIDKKFAKDKFDMEKHAKKAMESTKYDMVASPDEPYYRAQYWHWIKKDLDLCNSPKSGKYLALGCGQGRLAMPLAEWCSPNGKVTGIDFSESAIEQAVKYAKEQNILNIDYKTAEIVSFLKTQKSNFYDGVFLIEVIFFFPDYQRALEEIYRVLKPGGILFVSFRSRYFSALHALQRNCWADIDTILEKRSGRLAGSDVCFTWQRSNEIPEILSATGEFEILTMAGIGCCSGIPGDPHEFICQPSLSDKEERQKLMKLELAVAESVPDAGRYILCVAKKTK